MKSEVIFSYLKRFTYNKKLKNFVQTMNKRSKSDFEPPNEANNSEKSGAREKRKVKSSKLKINNENKLTDRDASKYFVAEILEPTKKEKVKKRKSIEIVYENVKEANENGESVKSVEASRRSNGKKSKQKEENTQRTSENTENLSTEALKNPDESNEYGENSLTSDIGDNSLTKEHENDSFEREKNDSLSKANDSGFNDDPWLPEHWEKTLELIREMRKHHTAPVDDQGCHKCSDPNAGPEVFRYQTLVALMLSSQTKDQVNHAAMGRLKDHGCTPQNLLNTPDDVFEKLIYPVSFYKRKVQYIKKASDILLKEYNGDIPKSIEGLCKLPGVGPKMGHLCMQVAWNEVTGIGVDTHVHRICNRLQWVKKQAKTPEETRKQLESWLPKNLWMEINYMLVGFGQEICLPQNPKCKQCLNYELCPYAKTNATTIKNKKKKE